MGVCGSDVHYYTHGGIGPFIVRNPMILGHEASGTVIETGAEVEHLQVGDRVCMEPGVPDPDSRETRLGLYNLDPQVRFWATPPDHGVLRPSVVHPAAFTFRLPDNVSYAEGAMIEPLAVGMHAVAKAGVRPGDVAVVSGAGPIGMLTALAALAGGCSHVFITDVIQEKLDLAANFGSITPVNVREQNLAETVGELTGGVGADLVFRGQRQPAGRRRGLRAPGAGGHCRLYRLPGGAGVAGDCGRPGERGAHPDDFPLRAHLPARAGADQQRRDRREAANHGPLHLCRQRGRL